MKRLLAELEVEHPDIKNSMIRALANVAPRHLLDTRLQPLAELRAAAGRPGTAAGDDDAGAGSAVPLPLLRR